MKLNKKLITVFRIIIWLEEHKIKSDQNTWINAHNAQYKCDANMKVFAST